MKAKIGMTIQRQILLAFALALVATPGLQATASHTWVAGNGSDANPGTPTQPCLTFQGAYNNTTAGGMISVLSPGDFGAVTISKAITIDGGAVGGSLTFTGSIGIDVNAGASDKVILRHLTVNGLNTGSDAVYVQQASIVLVEDCDLENFTDIGLAIYSGSPIHVTVRNTTIQGGNIGVRTFQAPQVNNTYPENDHVSIRNVIITGAASQGVFTRNGYMDISDSMITQNNIDIWCDSDAWLNLTNSVLTFNGTDAQFFPDVTGGIFMANNNTFFWNNGTPPTAGAMVSSPPVVSISSTPLPPDPPRHRHR